ncbi:MAG: hypothetical protein ACREX9_20300 [Gammaproteobacteria bacterium]
MPQRAHEVGKVVLFAKEAWFAVVVAFSATEPRTPRPQREIEAAPDMSMPGS